MGTKVTKLNLLHCVIVSGAHRPISLHCTMKCLRGVTKALNPFALILTQHSALDRVRGWYIIGSQNSRTRRGWRPCSSLHRDTGTRVG